MSVTLQLIAETATTVHAAMPVAVPTGSITDLLNTFITNVSSLTKVGVPVVGGLVVLFLCIKKGFRFGSTIGLALVAALVLYLSVGGGLTDISNMIKQESAA